MKKKHKRNKLIRQLKREKKEKKEGIGVKIAANDVKSRRQLK